MNVYQKPNHSTVFQLLLLCVCMYVCTSVCTHAMLEVWILGVELKLLPGVYSYFPWLEMNPLMLSLKMNGLYSSHQATLQEDSIYQSAECWSLIRITPCWAQTTMRADGQFLPYHLAGQLTPPQVSRPSAKLTSQEVLLGPSMSSLFHVSSIDICYGTYTFYCF